MTPRERVKRAIGFGKPDRTPVWYSNRDHLDGDIVCHGLCLGVNGRDEWGYVLRNLGDGTMGHPDQPVYPDWDAPGVFNAPSFRREERLSGVPKFMEWAGDHYRVASTGISGFNRYMFLRGFENTMTDFLSERLHAERLLDVIMAFETALIDLAAEAGFDGVHFADDWGTQDRLVVDPELGDELFGPRYAAQVTRAHRYGLEVWFHSCGCIQDIVGRLHEIGVDVINISQPNVNDIEAVSRDYRGRQCFMEPISYQTVSISGTPEEILAEGRRLRNLLETPDGGFIGYVEEYTCMGMTEENYQACSRAFWD